MLEYYDNNQKVMNRIFAHIYYLNISGFVTLKSSENLRFWNHKE